MGLRSSKVKIVDNVPKVENYLHLCCFGEIILSKDEAFDFLFVEIGFSDYHKMYVCLWPEDQVVRN